MSVASPPKRCARTAIVDEVRASGGDVKRICELFGITVETAMRYTATLDHTAPPATATSSGTQPNNWPPHRTGRFGSRLKRRQSR